MELTQGKVFAWRRAAIRASLLLSELAGHSQLAKRVGSGYHVTFDVVRIPAPHFMQDTRHQFIELDGLELL